MKKSVRVLHLSDLHYCSCFDRGGAYAEMLARVSDPLAKACGIIRKEQADVIVISGDLTDGGSAEDYAHVKRVLSDAAGDAVILPVLGNHDRKDSFRKGWLREAQTDAPWHWRKEIGDFTFIGIDNSVFGMEDGSVSDDEISWLWDTLADARDVILAMHHPLKGREGIPPLTDKERLLNILVPYRSEIRAVLCGHTHWSDQYVIDGIACFTTPSLSFRGVDEGDRVLFYDTCGFRTYLLGGHSVSVEKDVSEGGTLIGTLDMTQLQKELVKEAG